MHSQVKVELSDDIQRILDNLYTFNGRIGNLLYQPTLSYDMEVLNSGELIGRAREYIKERSMGMRGVTISKYWLADGFLYCTFIDLKDLMHDVFRHIEYFKHREPCIHPLFNYEGVNV